MECFCRLETVSKGLQGRKLVVALVPICCMFVFILLVASASPDEQYLYYAYIPPSLTNLSIPIITGAGGLTQNYVERTVYNYTSFPSNLDIVGIEDGTSYQLYDLGTKALLRSGSLNKYEHVRIQFGSRKTSTEPFEVHDYQIKLVTDKPVSAVVSGGLIWGIPGFDNPLFENITINGFSSFVPSADGGLIGRNFVFLAMPTFWQPKTYIDETNMYNIFATQDSKVGIYNVAGDLVQELDTSALSMARTLRLEPYEVYRVTSTGNIMIYGPGMNSMVYVPALTGGFVGNAFLATRPGDIHAGDLQSLIVVAMQDAKVELYDMRKPAGSAPDKVLEVKKGEMAFDTSVQSNLAYMVKSTGNITLLWGGNRYVWGTAYTIGLTTPENIANGMALLGARPGQEVGFFAPYQAVIFAAGDTEVEVNGIPRSMKKDDFISVSSGTYNVKPTSASVIIEVLGNANIFVYTTSVRTLQRGFNSWGGFLISPQDTSKSYAPVEAGGGLDLFLYIAVAAVAAVVVVALLMVTRRRKKA